MTQEKPQVGAGLEEPSPGVPTGPVGQEHAHSSAGPWAAQDLTDGSQGAGWGWVSSEGSTREGSASKLTWLLAEFGSLDALGPKASVLRPPT